MVSDLGLPQRAKSLPSPAFVPRRLPSEASHRWYRTAPHCLHVQCHCIKACITPPAERSEPSLPCAASHNIILYHII